MVSEEVGAQIVRFVARRLLGRRWSRSRPCRPGSLLCERLNDARLAQEPKLKHISAALVELQGANILQRFYVESFNHSEVGG